MVKKLLLVLHLIFFIFTNQAYANEPMLSTDMQWLVDTWEVCPINEDFLLNAEKHSFSDKEVESFLISPNLYDNIWISGWIRVSKEQIHSIEFDCLEQLRVIDGVYLNAIPYIESYDFIRPQGDYVWRRISFNVYLNKDKVVLDNLEDILFLLTQPALRYHHEAYFREDFVEGQDDHFLIRPTIEGFHRRSLPDDYFEGFKAQVIWIETIYNVSSRYNPFFDYYTEKKEWTCWEVNFWVGNDLYPLPIKCIYNYKDTAERSCISGDSQYFFEGKFEFVEPRADNNFTGCLVYKSNEDTPQINFTRDIRERFIQEIGETLITDKFSCQISFEPELLAYGIGGTGGPWYGGFQYGYVVSAQ